MKRKTGTDEDRKKVVDHFREGEYRAKRHPSFGPYRFPAGNLRVTGVSFRKSRENPDLPETIPGESLS